MSSLGPLTLGTAAFGMAYGVANPTIAVTPDQVEAILDSAWDAGIRSVDTAPAYGDAEFRLGAWMRARQRRLFIVSKLPPLDRCDGDDGDIVAGMVKKSLTSLGVDCIDGYLAHRASDLKEPGTVLAIRSLLEKGVIGAFGASIYTVEEARAALDVDGLTMLQVPVNLLDHRIIKSDVLERCRDLGVTVFARSVFLQGAFFMDPIRLPHFLAPLTDSLSSIQSLANRLSVSSEALALAFVRDTPGITSSVMGVYSVSQLRDLLACRSVPPLTADTVEAIGALAMAASGMAIDPRNWSS